MTLSYKGLHWGTNPQGEIERKVCANTPAEPVCEVKAVSYTTRKGRANVWRHVFEGQDGRGPYLLKPTPGGSHKIEGAPRGALEIGYLVDLEARDGKRIVLSGCSLCTDPQGGAVWLGFLDETPLQLERWGYWVTTHGIEG